MIQSELAKLSLLEMEKRKERNEQEVVSSSYLLNKGSSPNFASNIK